LILDSSAVIAVLFREKRYDRLKEAMAAADALAIGAPTLFETGMVAAGRLDLRGRALVAQFLERWNVVVVPFGDRHERAALEAFLRYGKGRHPAALNYGDCMAYATAKIADVPLLFTGNDFAQTDLTPALG
jgi:ribonuclease VapC